MISLFHARVMEDCGCPRFIFDPARSLVALAIFEADSGRVKVQILVRAGNIWNDFQDLLLNFM